MENEKKLPDLADVIVKVKHLKELTPEEDLVYLIHIEEIPEDEAKMMIKAFYLLEERK